MAQPKTVSDTTYVDGDGSVDQGISLQRLTELAEREDRRAFGEHVSQIDWTLHSPEELTKTLDLTLRLELTQLAVQLGQVGRQLFPEHERVQRAAHVLSPPSARSIPATPTHGLAASRRWLREHEDEYRGRWVAVRDGTLLGTASSLAALTTLLAPHADPRSTLIAKVL